MAVKWASGKAERIQVEKMRSALPEARPESVNDLAFFTPGF